MCILETWNLEECFLLQEITTWGIPSYPAKNSWIHDFRLCQGSGLVSPAHLATLRFRKGAGNVFFFFGGKMGEGNSFCGFVLFNYVMFGYHSLQVPDEMTPVPKMIFVMIVHHWCSPLSNCEGGYVLTLSPMALRASFPSLRTTGLYTVFRYGYATLAKKSVALVLMIHDLKQYCPLRKQESWFGMPFSIIYQLIFHWWLLFDSFINIINQL